MKNKTVMTFIGSYLCDMNPDLFNVAKTLADIRYKKRSPNDPPFSSELYPEEIKEKMHKAIINAINEN